MVKEFLAGAQGAEALLITAFLCALCGISVSSVFLFSDP
jgi:hypothetical protein